MLLEEHIIVQYSWLQENTMFPGTLEVTEDRQYREHGLIHISDACFECLKRIEEQRQQLMNETRLQQSDRKDQFVDDAISSDDGLLILWDDMFEPVETENQVSLIFQDSSRAMCIEKSKKVSYEDHMKTL